MQYLLFIIIMLGIPPIIQLSHHRAQQHASQVQSVAVSLAVHEPLILLLSPPGRSHWLMAVVGVSVGRCHWSVAAVGGSVCCPALMGKTAPAVTGVRERHQCLAVLNAVNGKHQRHTPLDSLQADPMTGTGVTRTGLIYFLAGCTRRQLNQSFVVILHHITLELFTVP